MYDYKNENDLICLINSGYVSIKEIAKQCNCNVKTANRWIKKFGLIFERKLITVSKNKIKKDLENLTSKDFCDKYKVSGSLIPRWKRLLGINVSIGRNRSLNIWVEKYDCYIGYTQNTNKEFLIDKENYKILKEYTWSENDSGYIETHINGKRYFQHRFILFGFNREINLKNGVVDHINRNKKDNRKNNLRITSNSVNQFNRGLRKDNQSGHTGVSYLQRDKLFRATINKGGRSYNLGDFSTLNEAVTARKIAEQKLYGEAL